MTDIAARVRHLWSLGLREGDIVHATGLSRSEIRRVIHELSTETVEKSSTQPLDRHAVVTRIRETNPLTTERPVHTIHSATKTEEFKRDERKKINDEEGAIR